MAKRTATKKFNQSSRVATGELVRDGFAKAVVTGSSQLDEKPSDVSEEVKPEEPGELLDGDSASEVAL